MGVVAVLDNGMSKAYTYSESLDFAKLETAKAGGNAFAVTDQKAPSVWNSTMHQIVGDVLFVADSATLDKDAVLYADVLTLREKRRAEAKTRAEKMAIGKNRLKAGIGYGIWTTPLFMPDKSEISSISGVEGIFSYDHAFKETFVLGVSYNLHRTNYTYENIRYGIALDYFALYYGMRGRIAPKWVMSYLFGAGYAVYSDIAAGY